MHTDDTNFNAQKASDLALKLNIRSAGVKHNLGNQIFAALKLPQNLNNNIAIGADVTHPPMTAVPGTPSIAAVIGSTDNQYMPFSGSVRLQRARKEEIVELRNMLKEKLMDSADKHNGMLSLDMPFYRERVSETQSDKTLSYDILPV